MSEQLAAPTTHALVWFRGKDLRLSDHAPLREGLGDQKTTCVFVLDPYFFEQKSAREMPARIQFLLESLVALAKNIRTRGGELLIVRGKSADVIPLVARSMGATRVLAHRWTEPVGRARDENVAAKLDVPLQLFEGELLLPPGAVLTKTGSPYQVFTPFSRAMRAELFVPSPGSAPSKIPPLGPLSQPVRRLQADLPTLQSFGIHANDRIPRGGEKAARTRLRSFVDSLVGGYDVSRDRVDQEGTSRLSCDLKFGTLSVASVWRAVAAAPASQGRETFLNQLLWREFAYSTLWHRPSVLRGPFRKDFRGFPYVDNEEGWTAWCQGQTGIPIVDAAARQLLQDGYVHNRARMISASFLTKNLLISYRRGEAHYLKHLADGDWALNNMGWQWSAGCGVDAAPYFRVFNPVLQGKKFDPEGKYVRRYVPELAQLPSKYIHHPWEAPASVLREAKIILGEHYPAPIVDLKKTRSEFLQVAKSWLSASRSQ